MASSNQTNLNHYELENNAGAANNDVVKETFVSKDS